MHPDADSTRPPPPADGSVGDRPTLSHAPAGDAPTASGDAARAIRELMTATPNGMAGSHPPAALDPPPGFAVERELGVGGMGVVYLARQTGLNRPCALKLVKAAADPKAVIRFLAEAEAVAAVRHPNVVEVFQYGDHRGKPYLALEYCPGGDLTALTKAERTRDEGWFRRAAGLMAAVADGVNAAHVQAIVHRDLKPHNVFLAADGTPKVADFGLAKRGVGSDLTQTDAVMGTPAYMAPEQAGGGTKFVGPEADVWALGVMLYELCCGERPIGTTGPVLEALAKVARGEVSPLRAKCPAVPADLALISHKCLSKDPRDRYPTAGGLAADLRHWLAGEPISARPAGVAEQAVKWAKRNKWLAGMGLAVLLTMAAATGVSLGFGLEANTQAGIARQKQADAEAATESAADEKKKAERAAGREREEKENAQRMLARALLGPISANPDRSARSLSVYEQDALWDLAAVRKGPVPLLLLEEATSGEMTAAQFRNRAEYLDHAAIGLDSFKRRNADERFDRLMRDASVSARLKRDVAMAARSAERFGSAEVMVRVLAAATANLKTKAERVDLAEGLAAVAQRLPADEGAGVLAAALRGATDAHERWALAVGLAAVTDRRPADEAATLCRSACDDLTEALSKATDGYEQKALGAGLAAVAARLPMDQRMPVAERLAADSASVKDSLKRLVLAEALAAVTERLPAEKAAALCRPVAEGLAADLGRTINVYDRGTLAAGLAAVSQRLPAERAAAVCGPIARGLAGDLKKASDGPPMWALAAGLAEVAQRLQPEDAAGMLSAALSGVTVQNNPARQKLAAGLATVAVRLTEGKGAELLTAALGGAKDVEERRELAVGLAAVAQRLPADEGAGVLAEAVAKAAGGSERRELAVGLAAVARRLPADRAEEVCELVAEGLAVAMGKGTPAERGAMAVGLAAVAGRLSPEKGVEVLTAALAKATGGDERGALTEGLAAVARRLPADKGEQVCAQAAALAANSAEARTEDERRGLARGLAAAACGLPEGSRLHVKHRTELTALAGVATLHPDVLPKPRPLPPQELVELLKHPFCVKEARRAVLDALELTYDRPFADLWEFVAFAEKEHPELDLLTPPKRPERK